ncbi:IS701 family transposase [Streptomyces kronopolitis]|uniref:IS701 family transposase n=1 Tax=Streptomyces kronopolitis TaxID=1612435 RepID=UPI003D97D010
MADDKSLEPAVPRARGAVPPVAENMDTVTNLCAALFAEFRRYDQRIRARQYLDGLLHAQGRKSIANIAGAVGVPGDEQRLHHFVSSSHWAWSPVRRALAAFLEDDSVPAAWVVLPVSIPKAGEHSVGVTRHFSYDDGQVVNGQQAYGIWYASDQTVAPVSWRLHVPDSWLRSRRRHASTEAPELSAATPEACIAGLCDDVRRWGDPARPVVMDARGAGEERCLASLFGAEVPVVVRISGHARLMLDEQVRSGQDGRSAPARTLLGTEGRLRCVLRNPSPAPAQRRPVAVATAAVRLPTRRGPEDATLGTAGRLNLVGVWHELRRPPAEVWLTNMDELPLTSVLRTMRLIHAASSGWRTRGEAVGLQDYGGRSFHGWHRHMTLASCAYALSSLPSASPVHCSELSA